MMLAIASFHCVNRELIPLLLRSWIRGTLPDASIIAPQIFLFHYLDVVLLVRVLPLFVEVDQCQVQQSIEQLEMLQISLAIAVFPETILSSVVAVQHDIDFVVANRLPRVALDDSLSSVRESQSRSSRIHTCEVTFVTQISR